MSIFILNFLRFNFSGYSPTKNFEYIIIDSFDKKFFFPSFILILFLQNVFQNCSQIP